MEIALDHGSIRIASGKPIAIKPPPGAAAWPHASSAARIDIGGGRSVVHVSLPLASGVWEWLGTDSGEVLFEAATTQESTDIGASVPALRMMTLLGRAPMLVRGTLDDRVRLCGQAETLLEPQGLDAKTLTWKRASLQQLASRDREGAQKLTAAPVLAGDAIASALPPVLALDAYAASSGTARAATDGDPKSAWFEERPGIGQGEFVIAHASGVTVNALALRRPRGAAH